MINRIFRLLQSIQYKYLLKCSIVIVEKGSKIEIGKRCRIKSSKIVVKGDYHLTIGDDVAIMHSSLAFYSSNGHNYSTIGSHSSFSNVQLQAYGCLDCGEWNIFIQRGDIPMLTVFNGCLCVGHHNRFMNRFWIRYNAKIMIGNYNNINENSWLRADEQITIGDYNQISYNVMIWDTNTHNMYSPSERRALTEKHYPFFGYEYEKPPTRPIIIGNDCWIAQNTAIMKGTELCNEVTVGYGTIVLGKRIPQRTTVVNKVDYKLIKNQDE